MKKKERKRLEEERKRKDIVQEPESSLMYTNVYSNPKFSLEQEKTEEEITRIYDNPLSSMLEELHQESVPYISIYDQLEKDSNDSEITESTKESESSKTSGEEISSEEEEIPVINMATEAEVVHPDDKEDSEGEV